MSSATYPHSAGHPYHPVYPTYAPAEGLRRREQYKIKIGGEEDRWESTFRDGLPTPPQTIMTGAGLGGYAQSSANGAVQGHYVPMYQPSSVSMAPFHVSNSTNGDYYNRNGSDTQLQVPMASSGQDSGYESKRNSSTSIATYLQIPSTINNSRGSLSEFAADITCLFWFESGETLKQIEEGTWSANHLNPDTTPTMGFRKWVTTILSTTQVTQNVILLALLFVYRLKKSNPGVSGKRGSEFRLFTIALMLGNKFLDDNTYTNKTWAEVSGIAVQEIHIMEVEFLSNMRYNLFVATEEWEAWHQKLGRFYTFLHSQSRSPLLDTSRNGLPLTPGQSGSPLKLPSPPSPARSVNAYPYAQNMQAQQSQHQSSHPLSLPPTLPASPSKRYLEQTYPESRKRSWEFSPGDRPSKRAMPAAQPNSVSYGCGLPPPSISTISQSSAMPTALPPSASATGASRLPVPRLQTSNVGGHPIQLPLPTGRAMASVYPSTQVPWTQPTTPTANGTSAMNPYSNPMPSLPSLQPQSFSTTPSRTSPNSSAYSALTPTNNLSPTYFLSNRNSPYRPIRHVHTLLNPPPSTSLQNPSRSISFDQMRYHPLSKNPSEQRTGVVPYLNQDAWPQAPMPPMNSTYAFHG